MASNSMPAQRSGKEASPPLFQSYNNKHNITCVTLDAVEVMWKCVSLNLHCCLDQWEIRVMILICLLNTHRLLLHLVPACGWKKKDNNFPALQRSTTLHSVFKNPWVMMTEGSVSVRQPRQYDDFAPSCICSIDSTGGLCEEQTQLRMRRNDSAS